MQSQKEDNTPKTYEELTAKQRMFVDKYCSTFNAKQAAIAAGYSKQSAKQIGAENLSKPYLKQIINARLDALSMREEEITVLLTEFARGGIKPFLNDAGDIIIKKDSKKVKLIKKIKVRKTVTRTEQATHETIIYELEIEDRLKALDKLAKIRGLYKIKPQAEGIINPYASLSLEQLEEELKKLGFIKADFVK